MSNIYPTPEGTAAIQVVAATLAPAELVGARVAIQTTSGMVFHGLLEAVSAEGVLTVSGKDGYTIKKFHVPADQVKSCKQMLFEKPSGRR